MVDPCNRLHNFIVFLFINYQVLLVFKSFTSMPMEPEFYNDLVYKFKKMMDRTDFSDQFKKITIRHKCVGYDLKVTRQCACFMTKPVCCTL